MAISSDELIETLQKEIGYREQSGSRPAKRDTDFIRDASEAVDRLTDDPNDAEARKAARAIANRIQSRPLRGRKLD